MSDVQSHVKMPLPTKRRALRIGAGFIENDLHDLRRRQQAHYESCPENPMPVSTSHEADAMKAAEWASAAAILRMLAEAVDA